MAEILTLNELMERLALDGAELEPNRESQYERAIASATDAIRTFTGRDFATDLTAAGVVREFEYDGTGFLNIDDAAAITAVTLNTGGADAVLDSTQWSAQPYGGPVYEWIRMPLQSTFLSPAMGFTRNWDVLASEGRFGLPPVIAKVTGTWGWPTVPEAVKQAAVWTVKAFTSNPEPVQQESIESYSRTIGDAPVDAIPPRAQALLIPYARWNV